MYRHFLCHNVNYKVRAKCMFHEYVCGKECTLKQKHWMGWRWWYQQYVNISHLKLIIKNYLVFVWKNMHALNCRQEDVNKIYFFYLILTSSMKLVLCRFDTVSCTVLGVIRWKDNLNFIFSNIALLNSIPFFSFRAHYNFTYRSLYRYFVVEISAYIEKLMGIWFDVRWTYQVVKLHKYHMLQVNFIANHSKYRKIYDTIKLLP